jgi:hypothetical protein
VQAMIRRGLERTNPAHADELQRINQGYSALVKIENAGGRLGGNGVFTPAQLDSAVRATDRSVRHNAFARGQAPMQDLSSAARAVLGPSYPDSGTAGRIAVNMLAGGGATMIEPHTLTMAAGASLPYLPIGRQVAAALMARRPDAATPLAQYIRQIVGPAAAVGTPALYQGAGQ